MNQYLEVTPEEDEAFTILDQQLNLGNKMTTYTIYRITNTVNNRTYIGMTKKFGIRMTKHKSSLKSNIHCNDEMQKDFNNGEFNFSAEILTTTSSLERALKLEKIAINNETNPYNIRCGRTGDMVHYMKKFDGSYRIYLYNEILTRISRGFTNEDIKTALGVSQPLISMVSTGFRSTFPPDTSFGNMMSCDETSLFSSTKKSKFLKEYRGNK